MASTRWSFIVQLLPADGWGLVVWYPDDEAATCEPLVAWALTEECLSASDVEMLDSSGDDAYERHFPRRQEREIEPVIVYDGSPSLPHVLRLYGENMVVLGPCRMLDFNASEWATSVRHARESRETYKKRALEVAVSYVGDHPGATQQEMLQIMEKHHIPDWCFNAVTETNPNVLVGRRVDEAGGWGRRWWLAEQSS
jgi:hypothetical protein